jgi:hypothetical protein
VFSPAYGVELLASYDTRCMPIGLVISTILYEENSMGVMLTGPDVGVDLITLLFG